jgi:MFS transporter, PAT family, beta-lactamase induction signal transducer AmpG
MDDRQRSHGLILSESRRLRLFSFFLLYLGQGLPLGIAQIALPAWLVANGADAAAVAAIISTAFLSWSFKFIPAALMDRYAYLPMGRRRAWLLAAQLLMVSGFALAALIAPGPDDLDAILIVVFLITAGSAVQDVAVDGLAVDLLPDAEQGTASSFMFGGQAVGQALAGAAAGIALQQYGSQITFLLFLPVVVLITAFVAVLHERPGEKRFPWSQGTASPVNLERQVAAWWPIFRVTFTALIKRDSLKLLAASALFRASGGMFTTFWPIIGGIGYVGYSAAGYASMFSTVGLVVAVLAIGMGSVMTSRLGPRHAQVVSLIAFALLGLFVLFGQSIWIAVPVFVVLTGAERLCTVLTTICSSPMRMQLSDPQVAATQFTIYNSLSNLPVAFGATLFAAIGGMGAFPLALWIAIGLLLGGAALFAWMEAGSRHVAVQPAPEID